VLYLSALEMFYVLCAIQIDITFTFTACSALSEIHLEMIVCCCAGLHRRDCGAPGGGLTVVLWTAGEH